MDFGIVEIWWRNNKKIKKLILGKKLKTFDMVRGGTGGNVLKIVQTQYLKKIQWK